MGSETQDREFARHVASRNSLSALDASLRENGPQIACVQYRNETHRATDFRPLDWQDGDPDVWVCGICHPPPAGVEVTRRATS